MNQISENLFSAIDIIVQERLKDLSYDKTLLCTIKEKNDSAYIVVYDGLEFNAYSQDNYSVNDLVYVMFPENNSTQQRIIIGKYATQKIIPQALDQRNNLVIYKEIESRPETSGLITLTADTIVEKLVVTCSLIFKEEHDITKDGIYNISVKYSDNTVQENELFITQADSLSTTIQQGKAFEVQKTFNLLQNHGPVSSLIISLTNISFANQPIYTFGNSIANEIKFETSNDILLVRSISTSYYKAEGEEREIYATYIKRNESGQYFKQPYLEKYQNDWKWERYIIADYNDTSMTSAWTQVGVIDPQRGDVYSFITNTKYPYQRFRMRIGSLVSDYITFQNSNWKDQDSFDAVAQSTEYYLHLELRNTNTNKNEIDVITSGRGYKYLIAASLRDSATDNTVSNILIDSVKLNLILQENLIPVVDRVGQYQLEDDAAAGYGILKGSVMIDGTEYIGYCSIGWRASEQYESFWGPHAIKYDNFGTNPKYNQHFLQIKDNESSSIPNLVWQTNKQNAEDKNNYPALIFDEITNLYYLRPLNAYYSNLNNFYVKALSGDSIFWIQPIVIYKEERIKTDASIGSANKFSTVVTSLSRAENDGSISGIFVGVENSDQASPGVFGFLQGHSTFTFSEDKFKAGGWEGTRDPSSDTIDDFSAIEFSYEQNGKNTIISNSYGAKQTLPEGSVDNVGYQLDLTNDIFDSKYFKLNPDPLNNQFGDCKMENLGTSDNPDYALQINAKNIKEKITIETTDLDEKGNWLVTYAYIKQLEERIAALEK